MKLRNAYVSPRALVRRAWASIGLAMTVAALGGAAQAAPVLMISIDGLRPADVLEASSRGLHLPVLEGLARTGAYASGVRDALPSVTYPTIPR